MPFNLTPELIVKILEQAFLFSLVSMGVYITYKILDFPDLSVDGSFPLGAAIVAALLSNGTNPWIATFVALVGGALAGAATGLLHVKLKISNLMSGIIVMIGLYSINLAVMGDKANVALFNQDKVFTPNIKPIIMIIIIMCVVKIAIDLFLKTKRGHLLIAVGDNEQVVTSLGISKNSLKVLGLMISNALVAFAGALTAQHQGFADINMGTGTVVKGLACVIIGVSLFKKLTFIKATSLSIIGTTIYYFAIQIALNLGLNPNYQKLLTAVIIIVALGSSSGAFSLKKKKLLKGGVTQDAENTGTMESI